MAHNIQSTTTTGSPGRDDTLPPVRREERKSAEETHGTRGFFLVSGTTDRGKMHSVITHDEPAIYAHQDC